MIHIPVYVITTDPADVVEIANQKQVVVDEQFLNRQEISLYETAVYFAKLIVSISVLSVAMLYNYHLLSRLHSKDIAGFLNLLCVLSSALVTFVAWNDSEGKNKGKLRTVENTVVSILFSLILIIPSVLLGNPWLSLITTNILTSTAEYPFMLFAHAFFFAAKYVCPESALITAFNVFPALIALVSLVEYEVSAFYKKKLRSTGSLPVSATTIFTGILFIFSVVALVFNLHTVHAAQSISL
ncbi:hypothetical protein NERG_00832 [Nematocida ausubeli]|uniref:Uncharacterized protein n=1 Tax=Nematocida ausubeli (strain ATCC PRA-371 / ERTm2) TaxID=1913371 RepID=H8ZB83_NEMA1|nr:hypothetical protein NERG_00832 [Nematocida ausubeli]